jgi:phage tail-like protein
VSNAFQRRPGEFTNRVPKPPDMGLAGGDFVWCLGSAEPGWTATLAPGDFAYVEQTANTAGVLAFNLLLQMRGTAAPMPTGWRWEVYARRGLEDVWSREVRASTALMVSDVVVPTYGMASPMTLRFGLRLVGPDGAEPRDVELPAIFIADTFPSSSTDLQLGNLVPSVAETGWPRSSPFTFEVIDPIGDTPTPDVVWVGLGSPAMELYAFGVINTDFFPGWEVNLETPRDGTLRFTFTPPEPLESGSTVLVEVNRFTGSSVEPFAGYAFTVEDVTPPRLEAAQGRAQRVVRVRFSEAMGDSALEPTAYTLLRQTTPAVEVQVQEVARVSTTEVDLRLDIPASPGASYQLVAVGVRDTAGNPIAAPFNVANFLGYARPQPLGRRFQLWDMLPEINREEDVTGDLARFIAVLQEPLELLLADVDAWTDILDVDIAEERYLDHMLLSLGNPFSFELTADDKRRLIRVLVPMMQQKGTSPGIINTVRFFLGLEVTVHSLNDPSEVWILGEDELGVGTILKSPGSRQLYSFEVHSGVVLTEEQRERIQAIVELLKPGHTHFVRLVEPTTPEVVDHLELGKSELGVNWTLH